MTVSEVELTIQKLLAGEERSYDGEFGGDPWGGYVRWTNYYGFDSQKQSFYVYHQQEVHSIGFYTPTERTYLTLEELKTNLLQEPYYY
jgi:hypothetical protein